MSDDSLGVLKPMHRKTKSAQSADSHKETRYIDVELLRPFANHPFRLYDGQRLDDFIKSVSEQGIITPITVRLTEDGYYEILAGHNRVNAAKAAGLNAVPAIIQNGISDEEAQIIVVESNLNQRSVKDMRLSELANSLYLLNEALKKKSGYRSDLSEAETCSQIENRSRTMDLIGKRHGLSQAAVARYIRVAQLLPELQDCLDNKKISMSIAVHLSYLRVSEQSIVQQLFESGVKISTGHAQILKEKSREHELTESEIRQIIKSEPHSSKRKSIKLSDELLSRYFTEDRSSEDIERIIASALELFKSQNPS